MHRLPQLALWVLIVSPCVMLSTHAKDTMSDAAPGIEMKQPTDAPWQAKPDITAPIETPDGDALNLIYADAITPRLFLTFHGLDPSGLSGQRIALYVRQEHSYRLVATWHPDRSDGTQPYLEKPFVFTRLIGTAEHRFLFVPGRYPGTGHHRANAVYHLEHDTPRRASFEPAPLGYQRLAAAGDPGAIINNGEGVWKGEVNCGRGDELAFTFYIWNDGDGNANPTAGRVDGTYEIIRDDEGAWSIRIGEFKRIDFDKG